jgi:predicted metalloprotease
VNGGRRGIETSRRRACRTGNLKKGEAQWRGGAGKVSEDARAIREQLAFAAAERDLTVRFGLSPDAVLPLLLSLRSGGGWCYASGTLSSISVVKKTTVYDERCASGETVEEIHLLVNPAGLSEEGVVHRLEKCGEEETRLIVRRPYRITVRADRIIRATVHPGTKEIRTEELPDREVTFEGSAAAGAAHELEHLRNAQIAGEPLWKLSFR